MNCSQCICKEFKPQVWREQKCMECGHDDFDHGGTAATSSVASSEPVSPTSDVSSSDSLSESSVASREASAVREPPQESPASPTRPTVPTRIRTTLAKPTKLPPRPGRFVGHNRGNANLVSPSMSLETAVNEITAGEIPTPTNNKGSTGGSGNWRDAALPDSRYSVISRPEPHMKKRGTNIIDDRKTDLAHTFSNKLLHKFDVVRTQVGSGLQTLKRMRKFFAEYGKLQRQFADDLEKLAKHEIEKLHGMAAPDRMQTSCNASLKMLEKFVSLASYQRSFASDCEMTVAEPLEVFYEIGMKTHKTNSDKEIKYTDEMNTSKREVKEGRKRAMKALESDQKSISEKEASQGGGGLSGLRKAAVNKLKGKQGKNITVNRALIACYEYQELISNANFTQKTYLSYKLPSCLLELQNVEEVRLNTMKQSFLKFSNLHTNMHKTFQTIGHEISEIVERVNADNDIETFVKDTLHVHGLPSPDFYDNLTYDLPKSILELKAEEELLSLAKKAEEAKGKLFGSTLEGVMALQENEGRAVPKIVEELTNGVRKLGGFQTVGIFRLSAATDEKMRYKAQVVAGDYALPPGITCHVPAALLKEFLRDLAEPLIPPAFYPECIQLGAKDNPATDLDAKKKQFDAMFSKLPEVNKRTIKFIANFLKEVAKEQETNKMGKENLAIVFAPSFLRDPSDNPMSMLENTQYESRFVIYLISVFSGPHPPEVCMTLPEVHNHAAPKPTPSPNSSTSHLPINPNNLTPNSPPLKPKPSFPAPARPTQAPKRRPSFNKSDSNTSTVTAHPPKNSVAYANSPKSLTPVQPRSLTQHNSHSPGSASRRFVSGGSASSMPTRTQTQLTSNSRARVVAVKPRSDSDDLQAPKVPPPPIPDLPPPLPDDWEEYSDDETGLLYYVHPTKGTQWERPT